MEVAALCLSLALTAAAPAEGEPLEPLVIYSAGLRNGWQDYGWTRRDVLRGQPARVDFFDHGGWIIGGRETTGRFQALRLWMRAPAGHGLFLAVRLAAKEIAFPAVPIASEHFHTRNGNWREIRIPYDLLNPDNVAFDTITLSAIRPVPTAWVYIDNIVLETDGTAVAATTTRVAGDIDDTAILDAEMAGVIMETPNRIGLAVHLGAGLPAGGGSAVYTGGLSARLSFFDGFVGLSAQGLVNYHTLAVQTGDPAGATIDTRSQVVAVPVLGVLTLRLPLGAIAIYGHTGCGGAWVWASKETLGATHRANTATWAVHGALGAEMAVGPGWLGLEAGYLILPSIELRGVLQQYSGGGLTMLLHYRLGV